MARRTAVHITALFLCLERRLLVSYRKNINRRDEKLQPSYNENIIQSLMESNLLIFGCNAAQHRAIQRNTGQHSATDPYLESKKDMFM